MLPPECPWVSSKHFSQFGPDVWPAIANIYKNIQTDLTEDWSMTIGP